MILRVHLFYAFFGFLAYNMTKSIEIGLFSVFTSNLTWKYLLLWILTWENILKCTSQSLEMEIKKIMVLRGWKSSALSSHTFSYLKPGLFIALPFLTNVFALVLKDIPILEIPQSSRPAFKYFRKFILSFSKKDLSPCVLCFLYPSKLHWFLLILLLELRLYLFWNAGPRKLTHFL